MSETVQTLQDFIHQRDQRMLSREIWADPYGVRSVDPVKQCGFDVAAVVQAAHDYPGEDTFDRIEERGMA